MLLDEFNGQTLTMQSVYEQHSVGRPFLKRNYKRALATMEAAKKISATPTAEKRQKRKGEVTFADNVWVSFPKK